MMYNKPNDVILGDIILFDRPTPIWDYRISDFIDYRPPKDIIPMRGPKNITLGNILV